jgi:hypothetical protein
MLIVGVALALGWKFITPSDRLASLESNQRSFRRQLNRQDSINIFQVVISTGVATYVCMQATPNEKRLMKLPCDKLLSGESLTVPGLGVTEAAGENQK